jgi:hypothetical protein
MTDSTNIKLYKIQLFVWPPMALQFWIRRTLYQKLIKLIFINIQGHYDSDQPLTVNVALPTPLLSRFDIVLLLLDSPNQGKIIINKY